MSKSTIEHLKTFISSWPWLRQKIVITLAVIGVGFIISLTIPRMLKALFHVDDAEVLKVVYSPNKQYKAVLFNENGGGAISPYCFDFISVVPASMADSSADKDSYRVYSGSCHHLGFVYPKDLPPHLENAPLLNWSSDSVLEITFDPTEAAVGIKELIFRGWADSGQIRVVHRQFLEVNKP
jgi:hypothetical protein